MNEAILFLAFTASWCAPCGEFKSDFAADPAVQVIDIDAEPEFARDYGVKSVPTVVAISRDNKEIGRTVGYHGKPAMQRWMARMKGEKRLLRQ